MSVNLTCSRCGRPNLTEFRRCDHCRSVKRAQDRRASGSKLDAAAPKSHPKRCHEPGRCSRCTAQAEVGSKRCVTCRERSRLFDQARGKRKRTAADRAYNAKWQKEHPEMVIVYRRRHEERDPDFRKKATDRLRKHRRSSRIRKFAGGVAQFLVWARDQQQKHNEKEETLNDS